MAKKKRTKARYTGDKHCYRIEVWLKHPAKPKSKEMTVRRQLHNIHERLQSAQNAPAPCLANLLFPGVCIVKCSAKKLNSPGVF